MRIPLLVTLLILLFHFPGSSHNLDSILNVLDWNLERRDTYFMQHEHKIDSIKKTLIFISHDNLHAITDTYHTIFDLYKSFQGDSAIVYAEREYNLAKITNDPELIAKARIDMLYSKITGGLFSQALEIVEGTDLSNVSDTTKGNFYFFCNRLFTDMSNYADGTFSDDNAGKARAYSDSVIKFLPSTSYRSRYSSIFKTLEDKTTKQKIAIFDSIMERKDIDISEKAMIASILGDLYVWEDDLNSSAYYKAMSAILDLQAAKRETNSKKDLAKLMFEFGDVERANQYINLALEDAQFFHARHRMGEISSILPIIEQARYLTINKERSELRTFIVLLIVALVILVVVVGLVIFQKIKIHDSKILLDQRNKEMENINHNLEKLNKDLKDANLRIKENNRIKDEYIGYGFYANAEFINKLENLHKVLKTKLRLKHYSDLENLIKEKDIKLEKEKMKSNFDKIFLKLFPSFIHEYKKLFPPDDPSFEKMEDNLLTPEMRIFALIRLGIDDCSEIARFLNYSVNTVNTYKTKAKNRSLISNDDFETRIMGIASVS